MKFKITKTTVKTRAMQFILYYEVHGFSEMLKYSKYSQQKLKIIPKIEISDFYYLIQSQKFILFIIIID